MNDMATSGIQHNIDAQENERPLHKRPRLAGDGESHAEWPQTASEPKATGVRGEQSAPFVQDGSQFGGHIAAGSHSYVRQGNTINNFYQTASRWPADHNDIASAEENGFGKN